MDDGGGYEPFVAVEGWREERQLMVIDPEKLIGYRVEGRLYHPSDVTIVMRED